MTVATLTGTYSAGYPIAAGVTVVSVTATGYVEGTGLSSTAAGRISVVNHGRINAATNGVYLKSGGSVTNGSNADTTASIQGYAEGVDMLATGTVVNFGAITNTINDSSAAAAVYLEGGRVTNGSSADTGALIEGQFGVTVGKAAGTLANFGSIIATGYIGSPAVALYDGGSLTNGTGVDTAALIEGWTAIRIGAPGTVVNFGTVAAAALQNSGGAGMQLESGGDVTNGSAADRGALIDGYFVGVWLQGAGTVTNFGVIRAQDSHGGDDGVIIPAGSSLTNGAVNDRTALIQGYTGVLIGAGSTVSNFGAIQGTGGFNNDGAYVEVSGTSIVNGGAHDASAVIEGYTGVKLGGADTLTNFGTIAGEGGDAVDIAGPGATLVVEAGCVFKGQVVGDGATLVLGSGPGTISGLPGANITVSGSMPATTFQNFATLEVAGGAAFTLSSAATVAGGDALLIVGSLSVAGALTVSGSLTIDGVLAGTGTLVVSGGTAALEIGTHLAIAKVTESGATTAVAVDASLTYAGAWTQTAGTVTVASGDTLGFTGPDDSFAGTIGGAGTVAFTGGADTLSGTTLTGARVIIDGPKVTLDGPITLANTLTATTANLIVGVGGATLAGGGKLAFTDLAANRLLGASGAATLTNFDDTIQGAGQLGAGQMTLVNDAAGTIDGDDSVALTLNTGANTIINLGKIEATAAGGVTIASALGNTGLLDVTTGTLTVAGAVTGAGTAHIAGGTADFTSAFSQNVAFTGTTGVLELAHSQTYTGTIAGFSLTGATSLDLRDISFISGTTKATYAGTATSGTLTVSDGTHTAHIKLTGDYLGSTFTPSSDGHGGTRIVDPTPASAPHGAPAPALHAFIAATASFGARSAGPISLAGEAWRPPPALAAPRAQIA